MGDIIGNEIFMDCYSNKYNVFYRMFMYIYCRCRSSYQEGRVVIILTGLTLPQFCASPKPGPEFPPSYVSELLRREVIVRFVDVGGIDDCLDFLFIIFVI